MIASIQGVSKIYGMLLRLFPRDFQNEFKQEMVDVFTANLAEAAKTGTTLLTILDLNGREMISRNLTGTITRVDINKLADGIYVAKLLNRKGKTYLKFIKN